MDDVLYVSAKKCTKITPQGRGAGVQWILSIEQIHQKDNQIQQQQDEIARLIALLEKNNM